ncbi:RDD family protein [Lacticaseibacillus sp. N501-2]|uniref:RDD family protein n=1 Tax=Lacticaseibacillus salsurae TaxID=3367729 RepID=UPI0038B307CF
MSKHHRHASIRPVPTPTKAPLAIEYGRDRVYASVIDWLVGGIVSGLPGVVAYAIMTGTSKPLKNLYAFEAAGFSAGTTMIIAILCLLFGLAYYVVVPWVIFPGQTLGKHWLHLQIVHPDGAPMRLRDYLIRQVVGLILLEGVATATATYVRVMITTATRFYVDGYFSVFWNVVTLISMVLVFGTKKHLAIHDYLAHTAVVKLPKLKTEVI